MKIQSFPPIADENIKVLILGTIPGAMSLSLNQYYGHGGNHFWKIMYRLFGAEYSNNYENKCSLLLKNRIGLWDILKSCEREGSSDNNINNSEPNDFETFFGKYQAITHICFNGQNAESYYYMYIKQIKNFELIVLPSTSPANTWYTFDNKVDQWNIIKTFISL